MSDVRDEVGAETVAELHATALELIDVARTIIERAWADGFTVERKRDGSFVTNADLEVEQRLRTSITQRYPEHGILGEEFPALNPHARFQWILDPIDGTEDFVHRVPTFGTILALYYRGRPVIGVLDHAALNLRASAAFRLGTYSNGARVRLDNTEVPSHSTRLILSARANFTRFRDEGHKFDALVRAFPNHRIYRSCFGHTLVAIGAADAMVDYQDRVWDIAAVPILVEEAGGAYHVVSEFDTPEGARVYSTVFGKHNVVTRLTALLK